MTARIALLLLTFALAACTGETIDELDTGTEIARTVETWAQRTPVPGVVVAMSGDGLGDYQFAYGTLTRDGDQPMEVPTPFRVASITKTLVAVVVLQLVEEGRISLDDGVLDWLPESPLDSGLSTNLERATIRDLLAHTSGLPDSGRIPELIDALRAHPQANWTTSEILNLVADREREFEPGGSYGYSNTNYLVLGMVIEQLTGVPWWREVRARILDPVSMSSSYVAGYEDPIGTLSPGYFDLDNDGFTEKIPHPWPALETSEGASGALVSAVRDLIRFMEALTGGDLISELSLREMTTPGEYSSRFTGYGLGVEVLQPDLETTVWGHGGFLPGHRGVLWHVPEHDLTVAVLTNESRSRPDSLAELILDTAVR
jgi:D-alanyl-D-alanine carboxypeptidase